MRPFPADSLHQHVFVVVSAVAAVGLLGALGCTGSPSPRSGAEAERATGAVESTSTPEPARTPETPTRERAQVDEDASSSDETPEELSDEIYFDDQDRAYRRLRIPKEEGRYKRVGEDRVQIPYGLLFYIDEETEDAFYVKRFIPPSEVEEAGAQPPPPAQEAERAERAPVVAMVEPPEVDRLRFVPFDRGLPDRGQWRQGFDVADVDGDGFLDIAHGPPRKGTQRPHIFLGDGEGAWRLWRDARFPGRTLDYGDAEVADFNDDGVADVAFASHLQGISVYVGDGEGGFELWSEGIEYASPAQHQGTADFSSRAITSLDWDGDGRIDLLALGEGPSLRGMAGSREVSPDFRAGAQGPVVFLNQGDGTWRPYGPEAEGREPFGDSLATGDFDGDGTVDFVTATNSYGAIGIVHLGQPDGTWRRVRVEPLGGSTLVKTVAASDLDGDGRDELIAGTVSHSEDEGFTTALDVLDLRPDGSWSRRTVRRVDAQFGIWGVAAGDVDGDGNEDLVAVTGWGEVWILLGTGDGEFQREVSDEVQPPGYLCRGYHVALTDLDGQGGDEIVIGFAGEPGAEQTIPGLRKHCPEEGALKAWKAE